MDDFISDVIQWDVLNWGHALRVWQPVLERFDPRRSRVLTLGERNGGLTLWFAHKGYQVVCSDFPSVPEAARRLHQRYGVSDRVRYVGLSAFDIPFADESFEIVACKSTIGGLKLVYTDLSTRTLDNQAGAVREIHRVLKPGGCWFGAENMRGTYLHVKMRDLIKRGNVGWRHLRVEDWSSLLEPFRRSQITYFGFLPTSFPIRPANRLSYAVNACISHRIPASWNYIAFVAAFK